MSISTGCSGGFSHTIPYGCSVRIDVTNNTFHHTTEIEDTVPTLRSYRDGLKVGCTFVSNQALAKLAKLHQEFLDGVLGRTYQ